MKINIIDSVNNEDSKSFIRQLKSWDFTIHESEEAKDPTFTITSELFGNDTSSGLRKYHIADYFFNELNIDFDSLPLLIEGESKVIRKLTEKLVIEKFKPTVYSYTHNRYGIANGTDNIRVKFSSELYRQLSLYTETTNFVPVSSFVAEVKKSCGHFMIQQKVESCNLEIRIKRYHIGSPLHRYKYTEDYHTVLSDKSPLTKWSRFDFPIVCFDWRNPLTDHEGNRLADEPISDDYAKVWMENVEYAKEMARNTFLWIEKLFIQHGIVLIDMCIFVDKSGKLIYGEISPDCMRIRWDSNNLEHSEPLCKDNWRNGKSSEELALQYSKLYDIIFKANE